MPKGLELKIGEYGPYSVFVSYTDENKRGPWREIVLLRGPGVDKVFCRDRQHGLDTALLMETAFDAGRVSRGTKT
ncbi:MAG: hypothetical protein MUC88_20705 [Planctomycetes bacterium]|jgi:hypothetical protein|nr:hypothetical protein [Planctomycetota bacterium]